MSCARDLEALPSHQRHWAECCHYVEAPCSSIRPITRARTAIIAGLTHLIRGAAIRAILGGQEALTRRLLDTVHIDHAAESATRRASSTR